MLRDQQRLGRRLGDAVRLADPSARERLLGRLAAEMDSSAERVAARRGAVPKVAYPPGLPVSQRKDEIAAAIRDHQVVVVAGDTGSGKTTQLPKVCLELGRGVLGQVGHTQPRRIAARSVAERVAEELGTEPGTTVGYKVRFTDTSSDGTLVKVMTDGILLEEMRRDRRLLGYDTLIIDEAHERSLNIDFILGYLKRLLPARPDLKVIITSATIDTQKFSEHFAAGGVPAPVIEVSGRTFPVEVRYRPPAVPGRRERPGKERAEAEPPDQVRAILDAIAELRREGPGDILVFLSGEREIRDTADALAGSTDLEVLPLYARLSAAEQHRVFERHERPRVVLATNIAETSLTVPGIRYVVDPGMARISRYSHRTKVQRLPIEAVSRASADQRKGRCGRTSDGICIRLYSEDDYDSRPEFTDPEVLRTSLASVILRAASLDLGEVADFPFVDPPEPRRIADGVRLLEELGAVEPGGGATRLTSLGRKLARLPVDPRLGRMIIEAGRNGCGYEAVVITAALSIQDPRERPAEERESADAMHARFAEPGSDFLSFLHLWDYLHERQRELSSSAFRRTCRREYLHYLRVREWQDVAAQLRTAAKEVGISTSREGHPRDAGAGRDTPGIPADLADRVHMSLLAGLLSHIGMRDTDRDGPGSRSRPPGKRRGPAEFAGARGARFAVFPDSVLARQPPPWLMAAELLETSRLWARVAARIEPEWAEPLAAHLVRRTYSEPAWDPTRGAVMALEKVTLYGLPIVSARRVNYARIDPAAAREVFIRAAMVEGDWDTNHEFFHHNQRVLAEARELEDRARRRGLVADDSVLFRFYDGRVPAEVTSARHFDTWWKKASAASPGLLTLTPADVAGPAADGVQPASYPGRWGDAELSYEFAPGEPGDGVTADIPLASLSRVDPAEFGWQVPGYREELVTELLRTLPKQLRREFVPAPDVARAVLARLGPPHGDLLTALSGELARMTGVVVPRDAWDTSRLPRHLRVSFRVTDGDQVLATGDDLDELRRELAPRLRAALTEAAGGLLRTGLRDWDVGTLPRTFTRGQARAYVALEDTGSAADVRLFPSEADAAAAMTRGIRRLLILAVPSGVRSIAGRLSDTDKLAMSRHPYPSLRALLDDCVACAADQVVADAGGPVWDAAGYARLVAAARSDLPLATSRVITTAARVLAAAGEAEAAMRRAAASPLLGQALTDVRAQFGALVFSGFISATGAGRLPHLVRYLNAIARRLDSAADSPGRDAERMAVVARVTDACQRALGAGWASTAPPGATPTSTAPPGATPTSTAPPGATPTSTAPPGAVPTSTAPLRWMVEELRVSLFAQSLGTPMPVSEKRVLAALDRLAAVRGSC